MGIYWNRDDTEPKSRQDRAAKPKPRPKIGPGVATGRAWTPAQDDPASDSDKVESEPRKR